MENQNQKKSYFQPGGSLPADSPTYVKRKSDDILYNYLKESKFCYILTARQMGKSSMRVRVSRRLEAEGYACVSIDLTSIGSLDTTTEQWYYSLLSKTCHDLKLPGEGLRNWWRENLDLSTVQRFSAFIQQVILKKIENNIVIFIDEIDYIMSLDRSKFSTDDFFAIIRHCYNSRADDPAYNRLTFTLLGVATPNDLMQDSTRTPFNIGYPVELELLDLKNSLPLKEGLDGVSVNSDDLLKVVFDWTGGHPYLTQKICSSICANPGRITDISSVDQLVGELFLTEEINDHNLQNVNNRILLHETYNIQMLEIIQRLLKMRKIESDDSDFAQLYLKLSGLVKSHNGYLVISNRIYETVFNEKWLTNAMGKIKRPFAQDMQRWLDLGKSKSAALRGEVLEQACKWAETREDITPTENEFLNFSRLVRQEERQKEIELLYSRKLKIRNRYLILALIIAIIAGIFAVYSAFIARDQALAAKKQSELTLQQKRIAESNLKKLKESLVTLSNIDDNCRQSIIEYLEQNPTLWGDLRKIASQEEINAQYERLLEKIVSRLETFKNQSGIIPGENTSDSEHSEFIEKRTKITDKEIKQIDQLAKKSGITIPSETKDKYPEIVYMTLKCPSMNKIERQYWFSIIPTMTPEQISRLREILETERKKLAEIDYKYENKLKGINLLNYLNELSKKKTKLNSTDGILEAIAVFDFKLDDARFKEIEKALFALKPKFSKVHDFQYVASQFYHHAKRPTLAVEFIKNALSERPQKIKYLECLAEYYKEQENFDEEQKVYEKILPILYKSISSVTVDNTRIQFADTLVKSALSKDNTKNFKDALKQCQKALEINRDLINKNRSKENLTRYFDNLWYAGHFADKVDNNGSLTFEYAKECASIGEELIKKFNDNSRNVGGAYSRLSWYSLFNNQYEEAIKSAKRGLELKPEKIWIFGNLAHGYLLSNQFEKAKEIYLKYKGKKIEEKLWEDAVMEDFEELKKAGITHPKMKAIEKLLGRAKNN